MPQVLTQGLLLCILLALASCGDSGYQVRQHLGYGVMPPGENWVAVDSAYQSPARSMVYVDPTTIRRDGALVTLWQLTDYQVMQGNVPFGRFMMGPHRFFSTKSQKEFDCVNKRVRLLTSSEHSQHMGTGIQHAVAVAQGSGLPFEPGSINEALWNIACGKSGEGSDSSSEAFLLGMPSPRSVPSCYRSSSLFVAEFPNPCVRHFSPLF